MPLLEYFQDGELTTYQDQLLHHPWLLCSLVILFLFLFFLNLFYLFIFGCVGSSLLSAGFL